MTLDGYLGALGQLPTQDQLRMNALAIRGEQQRQSILAREAPIKLRQQEVELAEQEAFKTDLMALGDNATPDQYWRLAARHPTLKGISDAAQALSDAQRRQVVGSASQIHAALNANRPDLARAIVQRSIDADKASGNPPNKDDLSLLRMIDSGDPDQLRAAKGSAYALVAASNPDTAAKNLNDSTESERDFTLAPGSRRYSSDGTVIAEAPFAPQYRSVGAGETLFEVGGAEGGDPASGGAAGIQGDVSRLLNTDAGGGYVPANVQTLGQFVNYGRALNRSGAKSSSAGTYQINGSTMAEFGPKALGAGWKDAPFNAETQERVGEAIFDWAKGQSNPAAALRGRWVSLTPGEADRLAKGSWQQARGLIAQKESGGGPSASAGPASGPRVVAQGAPKPGYSILSQREVASIPGLDPQRTYQRSPDGQITAVGGPGRGTLKPWPSGALDARTTNNATLANIDGAIRLLEPKNRSRDARTARAAIGPGTGFFGDTFTQWNNPEGTDARSRIGQIGGLIIKDTSGAAVSFSEDQRLAKWVPLVTDKPQVVIAKLKNLRREVAQRNSSMDDTYSEDQGYRPFKAQQQAAGGFRILGSRPK